MRKRFVGWHSVVIAAVACSRSTSPVCTQEARPALAVYVKNSSTSAGIASGASLVVRDGNYKDSVAAPNNRPDLDNSPLYAGAERAGTYQVTVTKTGFAEWTQSDVRVTANKCHVNTVTLTALLQPES
jgi:hypothetical protein